MQTLLHNSQSNDARQLILLFTGIYTSIHHRKVSYLTHEKKTTYEKLLTEKKITANKQCVSVVAILEINNNLTHLF